MKPLIKTLLLFSAFLIVACTPQKYYLEPELEGHLYNIKTQKPIINEEGYVSFYLGLKDENKVRTDQNGRFKVSPTARTYYFFEPNMKKVSRPITDIYIHFNGYSSKKFDFSNTIYQQNKPNFGEKRLEKLDVGIIYLDPK